MNAKEYVKKVGWANAFAIFRQEMNPCANGSRGVRVNDRGFREYSDEIGDGYTSLYELAALLRCRELVMDFGGLERARKYSTDPYKAPEVREALTIAVREVEAVEKCQCTPRPYGHGYTPCGCGSASGPCNPPKKP